MLLSSTLLVACGGDSGTGPEEDGDVTFPAVSANVAAQFCVRGTATPTVTVTGTLTDDDCAVIFPVGTGEGSFYETWRVRVGRTRSVTFETTANFDSFIDVFRIDDPGAPVLALENLVDFDDDSGPGANAQLTITLQVDQEYWVMVSGFDAIDQGPYSLQVRGT